jgi:ascorbate-specific PTS system EIIC-type component UlaA
MNTKTSHDPIMTMVVSILLVAVVIGAMWFVGSHFIMPQVHEITNQVNNSTHLGTNS